MTRVQMIWTAAYLLIATNTKYKYNNIHIYVMGCWKCYLAQFYSNITFYIFTLHQMTECDIGAFYFTDFVGKLWAIQYNLFSNHHFPGKKLASSLLTWSHFWCRIWMYVFLHWKTEINQKMIILAIDPSNNSLLS